MAALEKRYLGRKQVAEAIGVTVKTLGNWLDRGYVEPRGQTDGGRFDFSPYELAVLAIVAPLAEFGVPIQEALSVGDRVIRESAGFTAAKKHPALDSPRYFAALLASSYVRVFKEGGEWKFLESADGESALPAFIQINVAPIVRDAFVRAGLAAPQPGGK